MTTSADVMCPSEKSAAIVTQWCNVAGWAQYLGQYCSNVMHSEPWRYCVEQKFHRTFQNHTINRVRACSHCFWRTPLTSLHDIGRNHKRIWHQLSVIHEIHWDDTTHMSRREIDKAHLSSQHSKSAFYCPSVLLCLLNDICAISNEQTLNHASARCHMIQMESVYHERALLSTFN